ncbi:MAG TPA: endonuclease/exonuclease/phosphatase family protein [Bacteroidales bacterium]|nr:endonuclease/exonuclease/phosphatase family protein [Bacteroidales bacterium]HPJ59138.1 endonuclease/exonuclease/phosphatase family protein [Bacteroidales bacterium]HPR12750.1 endonuclease/exonuclease/phosphatase family protein [Bacteroidales bacterium]HRW84354.1 endonuclease/exonuclease/phosphatase family protein [Bacteroidales bacterium]
MKKMLVIVVMVFLSGQANSQTYRAGLIAFYNLENLFDTINNDNVLDEEFTPDGLNRWTGVKYLKKLGNMAEAISRIGEDDGWKGGPAILGVSEIENRGVLEDLIRHPLLREAGYQIVHYDSPDRRGVDVALLYRTAFFRVTASGSNELRIFNESGERVFTRDQLVVSGIFDGEPMHFIVNHWPSRSGGELLTKPRRNEAAMLTRHLVDSLLAIDKEAKVFVMGDLNDDPTDESLRKYLRAVGNPEKMNEDEMFNCMYPLFRKGVGSLYYRDGVNLFDQIVITQALTGKDYSSYKFYQARVFNSQFLVQKDGQYKGYPLRTMVGTVFQGGYSDHFPVYVLIVRGQ